MNAIKTKLQSNRGASITFALLLFLVCAVISSVVIVAATAAAGRMSEQADMDERYYAVTAVASKLDKEIAAIGDDPIIKLQYIKADNPEDIDISTVNVIEPDGYTGIFATASRGVLKKTSMPVSVNGGTAIKNEDESVECTVAGILNADGTLEFTIKAQTVMVNGKKVVNGRTYTLKLKFGSTLQLSSTDSTETTATATVKWELLGAEKQRNDRQQKAGS